MRDDKEKGFIELNYYKIIKGFIILQDRSMEMKKTSKQYDFTILLNSYNDLLIFEPRFYVTRIVKKMNMI